MASRRLATVPRPAQRAVLYVRVSAIMGRAGDDFLSPDLQVRAMRDLAHRRDLREIEVVQDLDVSGRTFARDGIDRILELAHAGSVDVVALYDLSRLGRNTAESLRTITQLRELGVSVISTVEQIDDTPEGQFQLGVFLGMAQLYSDQVGRRWSQVHQHNAERGVLHGRIPLGYLRTGPRTIEADPTLGPAVTDIFSRYATGESINRLAKDLARIRGRRVWPATIADILRSDVYRGMVRLNGELHPGNHPPLVDDVTWAAVQRRLSRPRPPSRTTQAVHSLAGIALCAECGYALWRRSTRAGGKLYVYLQCRTGHETSTCPGIGTPRLDLVEDAVLHLVARDLAGLADDPARRLARRQRRSVGQSRAEQLLRTINIKEDKLLRAGRLALDEPGYEPVVRELRLELDGLREQLADAEHIAVSPTASETLEVGRRLLAIWPEATAPQRNRLLRILEMHALVRRGGCVTLRW